MPRFNINDDFDYDDDEFSEANEPLIEGELHGHPSIKDGSFPKARQVLAIIGFCGFAIVYAMRVNLSITIVSMVNHTAINVHTNQSFTDVCPLPTPSSNSSVPAVIISHYNNFKFEFIQNFKLQKDGQFAWDERTQGIVLGSFFYGYVLTQIPGGRLAETLGGKLIYGIGVLLTAIFTLLTPYAAHHSLPVLIIVRIFEGMAEGVTYPSMTSMLAKWVPKTEQSRFAATVYNGANFGTIVSIPLSGYLCSLDFMGGWPLSFYIFGVLGVVWSFFWFYFVFDTPESHPRISIEERLYIEHSLRNKDNELDTARANEPVPWRFIFTSVPLWALLITVW